MKKKYCLLFDVAFVSYLLWGCLRDSEIDLPILAKFIWYLSLIFSCVSILLRRTLNIWKKILFVLLVGFAVYYKQIHFNTFVLPMVLLIFAADGININHIVKVLLYTTFVSTIVVILLSLLGTIPDKVTYHKIGFNEFPAHSFGFIYYSFFAFRFMTVVISLLYLKRSKSNVPFLIFLVVVSFLGYYLSYTRLQLAVCLSFFILYIIVYKLSLVSFKLTLWKYLAIISYPIAFIIYITLPFASYVSEDFLDLWNEYLSGRMALTVKAFLDYPPTLWGNVVEMVGAVQAETSTEQYFYIDSGYAFWIIVYGIFFTFLILTIFSVVFYRAYKTNNKFLYLWCLVFAFVNLVNAFFT